MMLPLDNFSSTALGLECASKKYSPARKFLDLPNNLAASLNTKGWFRIPLWVKILVMCDNPVPLGMTTVTLDFNGPDEKCVFSPQLANSIVAAMNAENPNSDNFTV